jgi:hypothetical protein
MGSSDRKWTSFWPAMILAILTLAVFWNLRDYGPENTIRKFHVAIFYQDVQRLRSTLSEDSTDQNTAELVGWTEPLLRVGYQFRIQRMDRQPDEVRAAVLYKRPGSRDTARIWVVERRGKAWVINANKSAQILRDALGL